MKLVPLATLVLVFSIFGCHMFARQYNYKIVVANVSSEKVFENEIIDSADEYNYGAGIMSPAGYANNAGPMSSPPNDVFTVRWKDAAGRAHEQRCDLRERVKRNFKGEIVFVYKADKAFHVEIVHPPARYPIPPQNPR